MKGTMKLKMSKYEKLCLTSNKRTYFKHKISLVFSSWAVSYFPLSSLLVFCVNQYFEPTKTENVGLTITIGSIFS